MSYNNKIIRRLHNHLFAPLEWLDRLENQHDSCYQYRPEQDLPAELCTTLTGLESTLEQMLSGFQFEQQQLFGLIEKAGKASPLDTLQPRRQRITGLAWQLLQSISAIHLLSKPDATRATLQAQYSSGENSWDDAIRLARDLSNQLVRHLYTAESTYLKMADRLLGPDGQISSADLSELSAAATVANAVLTQPQEMPSQRLH